MHINSLKIIGVCMKLWFISCPRHVECFSGCFVVVVWLVGWLVFSPPNFLGIYYGFTFNNYNCIAGIWTRLFRYFREHVCSWLPTHSQEFPTCEPQPWFPMTGTWCHQSPISIQTHCSLPILHLKRPHGWGAEVIKQKFTVLVSTFPLTD